MQGSLLGESIEGEIMEKFSPGRTPEDTIVDWARKLNYNSEIVPTNYSDLKNIPTTISGYGITDAYTETEIDTQVSQDRGFSLDMPYYYNRNIKQIATCESDEGWANDGGGFSGTYAADGTNVKVGLTGANVTTPAGSWGAIHVVKNLDLTTFNDLSSSSTADYICITIYISASDLTNLYAGACLQLNFTCDVYPTTTNQFYYPIQKSDLVSGWNFIKVAKSAILSAGSPTWSTVKGISMLARANSSVTVSVTLDNIQLIRKDPLSAIPNPFQKQINGAWARERIINQGTYFVGIENGQIICRNIEPPTANTNIGNVTASLLGAIAFGNFIIRHNYRLYSGTSILEFLGWQIDANNRVFVSNGGGGWRLSYTINGTDTLGSPNVTMTLSTGDMLEVVLTKNDITFTANFIKNGDFANAISATVDVSDFATSTGYIAQGYFNSGPYTTILNQAITMTSYASEAGTAQQAKTLAIKYKAGSFTANELNFGEIGIDTTNSRQYVRFNATTVKYTSLT